MKTRIALAFAAAAAACGLGTAQAQTAADIQQRNTWQQDRIEKGLKDGQLSTGEAGALERSERHVSNMEARDMSNGALSAAERSQIQAAQNREHDAITTATTNGVSGNPASAASQQMATDVKRNVREDNRILDGRENGGLTKPELAALDRGQARVDNGEAKFGTQGGSGFEQARVDRLQHNDSMMIHGLRHDGIRRR
jgi:hypothetical protein